jgi:hypothetical protein
VRVRQTFVNRRAGAVLKSESSRVALVTTP